MLPTNVRRNIHITQLNPQYIWGGDAIQLAKADGVVSICIFSTATVDPHSTSWFFLVTLAIEITLFVLQS